MKLRSVESPAALCTARGNPAIQPRLLQLEQAVPIASKTGAPPLHAPHLGPAADRESRDSFETDHLNRNEIPPPNFSFPRDQTTMPRNRPCRPHLPPQWITTADKHRPSARAKSEFPDRTVHRIRSTRRSSS